MYGAVTVDVKYKGDDSILDKLRVKICRAYKEPPNQSNPLETTNFNELLADLCQKSFDAGRAWEKSQRDKS